MASAGRGIHAVLMDFVGRDRNHNDEQKCKSLFHLGESAGIIPVRSARVFHKTVRRQTWFLSVGSEALAPKFTPFACFRGGNALERI